MMKECIDGFGLTSSGRTQQSELEELMAREFRHWMKEGREREGRVLVVDGSIRRGPRVLKVKIHARARITGKEVYCPSRVGGV